MIVHWYIIMGESTFFFFFIEKKLKKLSLCNACSASCLLLCPELPVAGLAQGVISCPATHVYVQHPASASRWLHSSKQMPEIS